ncbi:MAG: hypothetical protein M9898_02195 [Chitinophagaceae bacterium]|nr:hypothetical protein [Chitinophagaceae bacterium]
MPEEKKGSVPLMENPSSPPHKKAKIYPAEKDADGFYYASEDDETNGILSKEYDNGSAVKKLTLSNGVTAIIRRLKGRDFIETKKRIQADSDLDPDNLGLAMATLIDGKSQPPEYYLDDLYQKDYLKLFVAYGRLNLE